MLSKWFGRFRTQEADLTEKKRKGDLIERFVVEGQYDILNEIVLEPLDEESFEAFKKVDPTDTNAIMQTQVMSQMINLIRKKIEIVIQEGKNATFQLTQMNSTLKEEDE